MSGPTRPYTLVINGLETTLMLSDADAEKRGLIAPADTDPKKAPAKKAAAPNKARQSPNKSA